MYKISHVQPQITYLMLPGCLLKNMFLLFSKKKEVQYGPVYQYLQRNWIIFSLYTFIYAPIKQVMVGTLSDRSILNYQLRMWIFYSYAFLFFFSKFTKSLPWFLSFISICKCSLCAVLCLVTQSCLTLCDPMDCSLPVSSVYGISQTRILAWVAMSFSRGSPRPRTRTQVSHIAGRFFSIWAISEAQV